VGRSTRLLLVGCEKVFSMLHLGLGFSDYKVRNYCFLLQLSDQKNKFKKYLTSYPEKLIEKLRLEIG
jgi:hypothetical protein